MHRRLERLDEGYLYSTYCVRLHTYFSLNSPVSQVDRQRRTGSICEKDAPNTFTPTYHCDTRVPNQFYAESASMTNSNRRARLFTLHADFISGDRLVAPHKKRRSWQFDFVAGRCYSSQLSSILPAPLSSSSLYKLYNTYMPSSYYDIDAILAEEELVPCSTLFDFTYLSHLDPDLSEKEHFLPESSRIKMPLWSVEKWAMLGFVRLSLPRHYGRKARERLEADPSEADLR